MTKKISFHIDPGIITYTIPVKQQNLSKKLTDEPRTAKQIFLQEIKNQ